MDTITKLRFKQAIATLMVAKAERLSTYYNTDYRDSGICSHVGSIVYEFIDNANRAGVEIEADDVYIRMKISMLNRAFKSWEYYSGSTVYPIPDPKKDWTPAGIFDYSNRFWGEDGYGSYRRGLAAHCAIRFNATLTRINQRITSYEK